MSQQFPILAGTDPPYAPRHGLCLSCGNKRGPGLVYLSAGAVADLELVDPALLTAFFRIIYHKSNPGVCDGAEVAVVDELVGGQFDLCFCSTACLRRFFSEMVDNLDRQMADHTRPHPPGQCLEGLVEES